MSRRQTFQQSRGLGFVESIAIERNLNSNLAVMSAGVGPGVEVADVRERADHQSPLPQHVHTAILTEPVRHGVTGATGSQSIGGTGWVKIFIRVKGIAPLVPPNDYIVTEGSVGLNRGGVAIWISGAGIYSETRFRYRVNRIHPEHPIVEGDIGAAGRIIVNLNSASGAEISETPVVIDRIVSFTAQAPVTFAPSPPAFDWMSFLIGFGNFSGLYTGGTTDAYREYTSSDRLAVFGNVVPVGGRNSCFNPGLNTTGLLRPTEPMFSNPVNVIQLEMRTIGWRPATGPSREEYRDMTLP